MGGNVMIKNKVLTPVLSGVLAVTVAGSGVGYYFVNKDEPEKTMDTMKVSMTQVEQTVNDTVDDVQKAVSGKLDFAYDSNFKITFGDLGAAAGSNSLGISTEAKPIEISTKVRQKGQNSQSEIAAKYNNATIATLETIYARDSKTGYVRIPELSSAYIKATEEDIKKLIEDTQKKYQDKLNSRLKTTDPSLKVNGKAITVTPKTNNKLDADKLKKMLPDLSSIDSKKLEEKFKKWVEIVKSKITENKDNGTVSGNIDGNNYNYKVKSYSINGKQAQEAVEAVLDEIAKDQDIKKVFDDFYAKLPEADKKASKVKSFAELIAKLKSKAKVPENNQNKVASVDIYFDGEEPVGGALNYDGKTVAKAVIVNKSDVNAIDAFITDNNGNDNLTVKGSAKLSDGKINGKYTMNAKSKNATAVDVTLTLEKVVIKDKTFSGTVIADVSTTKSTGRKTTETFKISGTANENKKDLKVSFDLNSKNILNIDFTMNKTNATDVSIPTDNVFSIDNIEDYKKTCDIESFKANINAALGINLFGAFDSYSRLNKQGQSSTITKRSTTVNDPKAAIIGGSDYTFA